MHSQHPPPGQQPERPPYNPQLAGPYSRPPPLGGPGPMSFGQNQVQRPLGLGPPRGPPLGPPPGSQGPLGHQGQYHPSSNFPNRPPPPLPPFTGPPPPLPFPNGPPPGHGMRMPPPSHSGGGFRMGPPPPFHHQRAPNAPHLPRPPVDFCPRPGNQGAPMNGFGHPGNQQEGLRGESRDQHAHGDLHQAHQFRQPDGVTSFGGRGTNEQTPSYQSSTHDSHRGSQRPQDSTRQQEYSAYSVDDGDYDGPGPKPSRQSHHQKDPRPPDLHRPSGHGEYQKTHRDSRSTDNERHRSADDHRRRDREDQLPMDNRDSDSRDQSHRRRDMSRESSSRRERSRSPRQDRHGERKRSRSPRQGRHGDRERSQSPRKDRHGDRGTTREKSPSRESSSKREQRTGGSDNKDERSRSPRRHERSSRERSSQRSSSPHQRSKSRMTGGHDRQERRGRSQSSSRDQKPKEREGSLQRHSSRKPEGQSVDPSKTCQRWNDLERELREEEREEEEKEEERDPLEDSDQEEWGADDTPWIQCSPRENFYSINPSDQVSASSVAATDKLKELLKRFEAELLERGPRIRACQPEPEQKKPDLHWHVHSHDQHAQHDSSESESDSDTSSGEEDKDYDFRIACLENRANHPWRLAENLWFNDPGEMNDGPLCKCSIKQKKTGIRHNIFPGEKPILVCEPHTNNATKLHHYRVTISPTTNFLTTTQTVIVYDKREYIFEGFSLFSHHSLDEVPECKVVRFGREYTLHFFPEPMPEHFTAKGLDLFSRFLFEEILELWDFDFKGKENGCHHFHFMPRFARLLPNNGKEILSMHHVIQYLIRSSKPIIDPAKLDDWLAVSETAWQRYVDKLRHMIATRPGRKPSSIRIDQLDRDQMVPEKTTFPVIVHFGVRPAQLSYIGDPNYHKLLKYFTRLHHLLLNKPRMTEADKEKLGKASYRKLLKSYTRLRHLLLNKPRVTEADKEKLAEKDIKLQKIRVQGSRVREVTAEVSSEHMLATGIGVDICQHALMLPVLVNHLRYFASLGNLYLVLGYKFKDPMLLRYAMTHPSYKLYFGTTPDHVRNSLFNCGIRCRQDHTEHKKVQAKERKKGINQLYRIMSLMASNDELPSHIKNYERLEFLGDAVIEFLSSTHLYHLFPDLEEGGLATYRMALVQNQHLSVLAKKLELDKYMLYAHGPDLCRPYDLRHAMANCLEAVMGAIYLEAGLDLCRKIFGKLLFEEDHLQNIWLHHPKDPLQADFPETDRHMIKNSDVLQKLATFEEDTGMRFRHIRLLARAFTQRTVGYTNLTQGSNQRLEFLGDSVLQLVVSSYLYKHFPNHHEGHLSLLRSSLVNNKTQSIIAQDLGLVEYIIEPKTRSRNENNIPMKIMADLVEALIGAMYVDHGLEVVETFCSVVFYPRLKDFIQTQHWNDAKSQLQQCCLTLRVEGQEPDVPNYKVIGQSGPTNSRQYSVAVYFKAKRMSTGRASNIRDAEMEAAKNALRKGNFPHLWFQRKCVMLRKQREAIREQEKMKEDEESGSKREEKNGEKLKEGEGGGKRAGNDSRGRRDDGRGNFSRSEGRKDEGRRDERRRYDVRREDGRRDEGRRDEERRDEGRKDEGKRDDRRREEGRKDERRTDEKRGDRRDEGRKDERRTDEKRGDARDEGRKDGRRSDQRRDESKRDEGRRDERRSDQRGDNGRRDEGRKDARRSDERRKDDKRGAEGRHGHERDRTQSSRDDEQKQHEDRTGSDREKCLDKKGDAREEKGHSKNPADRTRDQSNQERREERKSPRRDRQSNTTTNKGDRNEESRDGR